MAYHQYPINEAIKYANAEKTELTRQKTAKQGELTYWNARSADTTRTAALAAINAEIANLDAQTAVFDAKITQLNAVVPS